MSIMTVNIILLLFLAVNARSDLMTRTVYVPLCMLTGIAGILFSPVIPGGSWQKSIAGLAPALVLLVLSLLWQEHIGCGDAYVLAACGAWLGAGDTLELLLAALLLAGGFSVCLLLRKRAGRKTQLPFVPFLLAGQFLRILI